MNQVEFGILPAGRDVMKPNAILRPGKSLVSKNGKVIMMFERNGTLSIRVNGKVTWTSGSPGAVKLVNQYDGNLVAYTKDGQPTFSTRVVGGPVDTVIQNDGNLVQYTGNGVATWSAAHGTTEKKNSIGSFLEDAAKVAGSIMPIAQAVLSVTGVGSIISGAIGMAGALVSGKNITDSFVSGLQDAIPGGPAVKTAISVTKAAIDGKPIDQIAVAALPLPENTKEILSKGLSITKAVASGQSIPAIALSEAYQTLPQAAKDIADKAKSAGIEPAMAVANASMSVLPKDMRKAVALTVAVNHAANVQKVTPPESLQTRILTLQNVGAKLAQKNPTLNAARNLLHNPNGFDVGTGVMIFGKPSPKVIGDIRTMLKPGDERKGFDIALAMQIGRVTEKKKKGDPKVLAGYYVAMGLRKASSTQKVALIKTMSKDPKIARGVKIAAKERLSIWRRVKRYLGLEAA